MVETKGNPGSDAPPGAPAKRRLLFVSNLFPDTTAPYRGLDNAAVLHELRQRHGWDIATVCPRPTLAPGRLLSPGGGWTGREQDRVLQPRFVPVPYVPRIGSRVNHLLMAARLRPVVRKLAAGFDVMLASWLYPDGCAAVRVAADVDRPCVLITQGSDTHQYLLHPVRRRLILDAVASSQGVISRSRDLARRLAEAGAAPEKIRPIYNGVDLTVFRPQTQAEARAKLNLPADAPVALFVGNFLDVKNPLLLVRAFARFAETQAGCGARLVMAGRGPMQEEARRLAASTGLGERVCFTGPLDSSQIALHMAAADFLCLSSRNEGLPNVILEAFACGLPVLSTHVGGIAEIVNDPSLGHLVPAGDEEAFSAGLQHMTAHAWSRDAIAAVGARFGWEHAAAGYHALLCQALDRRRCGKSCVENPG